MQVDEASNAAAAFDLLRSRSQQGRPYDVALLDMQMPNLDGEMLGRQIKADAQLSRTRLVMLTSTYFQGGLQRLYEQGFAAYLIKPVRQSRLFDCLISVLCPVPANLLASLSVAIAAQPALPSSPSLSGNSRVKILLAEDSQINQKVALNQLKHLGYAADVAANGAEVLDLLRKIRYDIVLMDCQMPILDGYDTTQQIRSQSYSQPIIIAMTANALKEDRDRCLAAGMDDYISKPVCKEALALKLAEWGRHLKIAASSEVDETIATDLVAPAEGLLISNSEDTLIDWNYLHQISSHSEAFEQELLQTLLNTLPPPLEHLRTCLAGKDYRGAEQAAHYIKGCSASVGAKQLKQQAFELEQQASAQQLDECLLLLHRLEQSFNRIRVFITSQQSADL
jgi:hypothetical protein